MQQKTYSNVPTKSIEHAQDSADSYKAMRNYVRENIYEIAREALHRDTTGAFATTATYFAKAVSLLRDISSPHAMVDSVINSECLKIVATRKALHNART